MTYKFAAELKLDWRFEDKLWSSKGSKLSKTKIEYLERKFNDITHEVGVEVWLDAHAMPKEDISSTYTL